jgi:Holliday junction resolvasome RuvABC DNA-binding subunit
MREMVVSFIAKLTKKMPQEIRAEAARLAVEAADSPCFRKAMNGGTPHVKAAVAVLIALWKLGYRVKNFAKFSEAAGAEPQTIRQRCRRVAEVCRQHAAC